MDFDLPEHIPCLLAQLDALIEADIRPLETAADNARFFGFGHPKS